jgi:hypothetical protein
MKNVASTSMASSIPLSRRMQLGNPKQPVGPGRFDPVFDAFRRGQFMTADWFVKRTACFHRSGQGPARGIGRMTLPKPARRVIIQDWVLRRRKLMSGSTA